MDATAYQPREVERRVAVGEGQGERGLGAHNRYGAAATAAPQSEQKTHGNHDDEIMDREGASAATRANEKTMSIATDQRTMSTYFDERESLADIFGNSTLGALGFKSDGLESDLTLDDPNKSEVYYPRISSYQPTATSAGEKPSQGKDAPPAQRSKAKTMTIMLALCMAVFLAALDVTIITTALPTISENFHSSAGYTWIGSAYILGNAASTPLWGKISDIWGRKPILLVANFVFFVGSLLAGVSQNVGMLIVARAIQGIGGGGLVVLVNIVIGDLFSPRERGGYYAMVGGVWAVASSLGPIVGGAFSEKVTWRWCFYINLPLDGLVFAILLFVLDLKTPKTPILAGLKAIDWMGSLLIIGGTVMLLLGLEFGGVTFPWNSANVICLIVFGIFMFVLFGLWEWKFAIYPIMPGRIFRYRSNLACLGVCFFHGYVFMGAAYYMPLYFQAVLGATPILSGVYTLATSFSLAFGSIFTGIFIRKTGMYRPPIYIGLALMTTGVGLFINLKEKSATSWAKVFLYQIVSGSGIGLLFQAPLIALQSLIAPRDIATATATFGFTRQLATSASVVVGAVVFQNQMLKKAGMLSAALGPTIARQLGGGNAGASVGFVNSLPPAQRAVAQTAMASSLDTMWIMYTVFGAVGLAVAFLITKQTLSREHQEMKTGLEAEKENRQKDLQEKAERRARNRPGTATTVETANTTRAESRPGTAGTAGTRETNLTAGTSNTRWTGFTDAAEERKTEEV